MFRDNRPYFNSQNEASAFQIRIHQQFQEAVRRIDPLTKKVARKLPPDVLTKITSSSNDEAAGYSMPDCTQEELRFGTKTQIGDAFRRVNPGEPVNPAYVIDIKGEPYISVRAEKEKSHNEIVLFEAIKQ